MHATITPSVLFIYKAISFPSRALLYVFICAFLHPPHAIFLRHQMRFHFGFTGASLPHVMHYFILRKRTHFFINHTHYSYVPPHHINYLYMVILPSCTYFCTHRMQFSTNHALFSVGCTRAFRTPSHALFHVLTRAFLHLPHAHFHRVFTSP